MKYVKQFGIILLISFAGEALNYLLSLPVPASIYGLVLMFLCLQLRVFRLEDVRGDEHKDRDDDREEQGIEERQTEALLQHHAEPVGKQAERNAEKDGVFKKFHAHTSLPRRRKNCVTRPETTMTSTVVITAMAR